MPVLASVLLFNPRRRVDLVVLLLVVFSSKLHGIASADATGVSKSRGSKSVDCTSISKIHVASFVPLVSEAKIQNALGVLVSIYNLNRHHHDRVPCDERIQWSLEVQNTMGSPMKVAERLFLDVLKRPAANPSLFTYDVKRQSQQEHQQHPLLRPDIIVGAARSLVTETMTKLTSNYRMPVVSHSSRSDALEMIEDDNDGGSTSTNSFFARMVPSTEASGLAAANYFASLPGVSHVAMLFFAGPSGNSLQRTFVQAATRLNLQVRTVPYRTHCFGRHRNVYDFSDCATLDGAIDQLIRFQYRYIYAFIPPSDYDLLMKQAWDRGFGRDHTTVWIFDEVAAPKQRYPKGSALAMATNGIGVLRLGVFPDAATDPVRMQRFLQEWSETLANKEFQAFLQSQEEFARAHKLFAVSTNSTLDFDFSAVPPSTQAILLHDTVMTIARAVCRLMCGKEAGREHLPNLFVDHVDYLTGEKLMSAIKATEWNGASGRIAFCPDTGTRRMDTINFVVTNYVANKETAQDGMTTFSENVVYDYVCDRTSPTSAKGLNDEVEKDACGDRHNFTQGRWKARLGAPPFTYNDGSQVPPPSIPPPVIRLEKIATGVLVVGFVFCCLLALASLGIAYWVIRHRKRHVIRASQPVFLLAICAGTFLMALAVIPRAMEEPLPKECLDAACMATWWLWTISFALNFSVLLAKTKRLKKIMTRNPLRSAVHANEYLTPVGASVGTVIFILSLWTWKAPLRYRRRRLRHSDVDEFGRPVQFVGACETDSPLTWFFVAWTGTIEFWILAMAIYELLKVRHVQTHFSETRYMGWILITCFNAWFMGMPIWLDPETSRSAQFLAPTAISFFIGGATLSLLFAPKAVVAWKMRHCDLTRTPSSWFLSSTNLDDFARTTRSTRTLEET